ncbi:hypothetical protein FACS1894126_1140 [Alphaproteobacteria bacterium]|nr:hypothetical protein FACS1894126_1140 [Alphaproteobacteria bacterium]
MIIKKILLASVSSFALVGIVQEGYAVLQAPNPEGGTGSSQDAVKQRLMGLEAQNQNLTTPAQTALPEVPAKPNPDAGNQQPTKTVPKTTPKTPPSAAGEAPLDHKAHAKLPQINDADTSSAGTTSAANVNDLDSRSFGNSSVSANTTTSWKSTALFPNSFAGSYDGLEFPESNPNMVSTLSSYNTLFDDSGSSIASPSATLSDVPKNVVPSTRAKPSDKDQKKVSPAHAVVIPAVSSNRAALSSETKEGLPGINMIRPTSAQESGPSQTTVPQNPGSASGKSPLNPLLPLAKPSTGGSTDSTEEAKVSTSTDPADSSTSTTSAVRSNALSSRSSLTPESSVEGIDSKTQNIVPTAPTEVDIVPASSISSSTTEVAHYTTLSDPEYLEFCGILVRMTFAVLKAIKQDRDVAIVVALARYIEGFPNQDSKEVRTLKDFLAIARDNAQSTTDQIIKFVAEMTSGAPMPAEHDGGPILPAFSGSLEPGLAQAIGWNGNRTDMAVHLGNLEGNGDRPSFCIGMCTNVSWASEFYKGQRYGIGVTLYIGRDSEEKLDSNQNCQGTGFLNREYSHITFYVGEMLNGVRHGRGLDMRGGDEYFMTWNRGIPAGYGVRRYKDGGVREGKWIGDRSMTGIVTNAAGDKYEGTWNNLAWNGKDEPLWSRTMSRGHWKQVGKGKATLADGTVYTGTFKDSEYHGAGELTLKNGSKYNGQFASGKFNGPGTLTWPDGRVYTGIWANGEAIDGRMAFPKNTTFKGDIGKNGLPNGRGTYIYADGNCYTGYWRDGNRHGQGTYTLSDSSEDTHHTTFDGNWIQDQRNGNGKIRDYRDRVVFDGRFLNDLKDGQCYYEDPDGFVCRGVWERDDLVNGIVTLTDEVRRPFAQAYPAGTKYVRAGRGKPMRGWGNLMDHPMPVYFEGKVLEGSYEGSLNAQKIPHGKGVLTFISTGKRYEGEWANGTRTGKGTLLLPNKTKEYTGDWVNDAKEGTGTYNLDDGRVYIGQFKGDKMDGEGTMTYSNGKVYSGHWKEDKRDGEGTTKMGPIKYKGEWKNDVQISGEKPPSAAAFRVTNIPQLTPRKTGAKKYSI